MCQVIIWLCDRVLQFQSKIHILPLLRVIASYCQFCQITETELYVFVIITQDTSKSPIAAEQQEEIVNSDTACCDDVDDKVLSDEALDKLNKELGGEGYDENMTGVVLNGTGEEEIDEVVSLSYRPFQPGLCDYGL